MLKNIFNLIKKDLRLILGNYFQQIVSVLFGVFIAEKILPEAYGIFGLAILLVTYLKFLNFGAQFTINKRLSIRPDSSLSLRYLSLNLFIYPILIGTVLFLFYQFSFMPLLNPYYFYIWCFLSFDNLFQLLQGVLRAKGMSNLMGNTKGVTGLFIGVLIMFFLKWGHNEDPLPLFIKLVIVPLMGVFYLVYLPEVRNFILFPKKISFKKISFFLVEGTVLGVYVFLQDLLSSIDRFFIAANYSILDLGMYSFAFSITGPLLLVLTTVMYMDYSRHMKVFKNIEIEDFNNLTLQILKKLFTLYLVLLIAGLVGIYLLLNLYLTKYMPSFYLIIFMLIGFIPNILTYPYSVYFIANGQNKIITKVIFIGVIITSLLNYLVIIFNMNYYWILGVTVLSKGVLYFLFKKKFKQEIHV